MIMLLWGMFWDGAFNKVAMVLITLMASEIIYTLGWTAHKPPSDTEYFFKSTYTEILG